MVQSGRELDRQATRLVRRAIVHHSMDKGYRSNTFPREELLADGYSRAVVRKARYLDEAALARLGWFVPFYLCIAANSTTRDKHGTLELFLLAVMVVGLVVQSLYRIYRCLRTRPPAEDDQLLVEELTPRLGPETLMEAFYADEYPAWRNPQPCKALLWRLDAFLSRKPANG